MKTTIPKKVIYAGALYYLRRSGRNRSVLTKEPDEPISHNIKNIFTGELLNVSGAVTVPTNSITELKEGENDNS